MARLRVVVDPIDGSVNAKRGIPFFSFSLAVAEGPTMGDVTFGYVYDFGSGEEWTAERGEGAFLDGERLGALRPKDAIEILSFEGTTTPVIADRIGPMLDVAGRVRVMGSLALSLCHLAAGRVDGVVLAEGGAFGRHRRRPAARPRVRARDRAVRGSAVRVRAARSRRALASRSCGVADARGAACDRASRCVAATLAAMKPDRDAILKALENVIDPELQRPVTELEMVRDVLVEDDGSVSVTIALTVAGCPLRDSFQEQVSRFVGEVPGVTRVRLGFDVMTPEEKSALVTRLRGGTAPSARSRCRRELA